MTSSEVFCYTSLAKTFHGETIHREYYLSSDTQISNGIKVIQKKKKLLLLLCLSSDHICTGCD